MDTAIPVAPARANWLARSLAACALLSACGAHAATLQAQRDAFRAAYAAAQSGRDWRALAHGLHDYPLYPYLQAAALRHDLENASRTEIDAYLARYPGLIPADDLRRAELGQLAHNEDWTGFQHFYRPGLGDALTCAALQARLAQGKPLEFERDLSALWQQTRLPPQCAPVLDAASRQGLLTGQRLWDRIERAADAGAPDTIFQAATWLEGDDAAAAQRIAEALASPSDLLKQASSFPDMPRDREAVSRALAALARHDDDSAEGLWQSLKTRFAFGPRDRDRVLSALALYDAVDDGPDALQRLAALPASAQTEETREWRVRVAVAQGDWKAAQAAIDALPPEAMQHDEWRYWRARIAQKLGQETTALDGYTSLARQATFFGFLAADRADMPYSICPRSAEADPAVERQLRGVPGLARAFEFFALDMLRPARREWDRAFADLTPAQQTQAVLLASKLGWYDRAIFAFGSSGQTDYYALRFPLADRDRVLDAARAAGVDPAWAYAIIRAESAWQTDARSGADARGLMQLLPGTAALVSRHTGLPYGGDASLYDPSVNIPLGTRYLARLAQRFDGSPWLASAAYNAGPVNVRRWIDARGDLDPERFIISIPFRQTRDYVRQVLSFATLYDWRLHGSALPVSTRLPAIGTAFDPPADPVRKQVVCRAPEPAAPSTVTPPAPGSVVARPIPARNSPP
jgi:peptidoglycan lytic transglycosylase